MNKERIENDHLAIPSKYRKLYDRVMAGKASPREAIKLHCLECFGYSQVDTKKCDNYLCKLYRFRPYQKVVKSPTEPVHPSNDDELGETDN